MKHRAFAGIAALVAFLLTASTAPAATVAVLDAKTRAEIVDALAETLASSYAVPEAGERLSTALRSQLAAGDYDKLTSPDDLAQVLQANVRAVVDDKHLRVTFEGDRAPTRPAPGAERPQEPPPAPPGVRDGAIGRLQILPGNVGYMEVSGVPPGATLAIDAAFAYLRNTDALIIDLRGNGGGWPDTVAYYMSYLSEGAPHVVMRIEGRDGEVFESSTADLGERAYGASRPLYVLTSRYTFSGGEEFAYDVQAFKRGTVVGETTGGGANPGGPQPLGHGFTAFVPTGLAKHPVTGASWEGTGVKPDVPVEPALAVLEAHRLAVESLAGGATETARAESLRAIAAGLADRKANASVARVPPATMDATQFTGRYTPAGGGGPFYSVVVQDGRLILQPSNTRPALQLEPVSASTFHLVGLPEDFTATFSVDGGGTRRMLLQKSNATPPLLLEKQ